MLKNGRGSWNDPPARATRGLRRMRKERPGALLARRTRTMKLCSSDARSRGQPWPLPSILGWRDRGKRKEVWRFPVLAQRAVADSPRWTRARREKARLSLPALGWGLREEI